MNLALYTSQECHRMLILRHSCFLRADRRADSWYPSTPSTHQKKSFVFRSFAAEVLIIQHSPLRLRSSPIHLWRLPSGKSPRSKLMIYGAIQEGSCLQMCHHKTYWLDRQPFVLMCAWFHPELALHKTKRCQCNPESTWNDICTYNAYKGWHQKVARWCKMSNVRFSHMNLPTSVSCPFRWIPNFPTPLWSSVWQGEWGFSYSAPHKGSANASQSTWKSCSHSVSTLYSSWKILKC